jgi:hypothetical protein
VGKLHDLEADIGVLCAWGGFGAGARARAEGATHPRIELRDLADLEALQEWPEVARRLLRERACPNPNCWDDVALHEWRVLSAGQLLAQDEFVMDAVGHQVTAFAGLGEATTEVEGMSVIVARSD